MKKAYFICGGLSVAYYLLIGFYARFGMSLSYIWLVLGILLIVCGFLAGKTPKWLRTVWRCCLAAGLVFVMVLEGMVLSGMNARPTEPVQYLVVLGARVEDDGQPSKALRHRIDAALGYLAEDPDAVVVASGGAGSDEVMTEAACIARELTDAGIAPERILIEDRSTDTCENLKNTMKMIGPDASVAIVTNNFHVCRSLKLAKHAGFRNVQGLAAGYTGPTLPHYMIREAIGLTVDFLRGRL